MGAWRITRSPRHRPTARRRLATLAIAVTASLVAGYGYVVFDGTARAVAAQTRTAGNAGALAGMASLSGTVDAGKPFKAAQVYIRNVDKRMLYMVYTNAGRFRAVALFPGNYEVSVQAKGLESDVQKLVLKAGDRPTLKLSMRDASQPSKQPSAVADQTLGVEVSELDREAPAGGRPAALTFASYDEIYRPGPGKDVAEQVCMACHGENFLPGRPANEAEWNRRIDYMMGKELWGRDKRGLQEGVLAPPTSMFRFGHQDRADLVAYLVTNFGPGAKPRAVRTDRETPRDEAKLGKAMMIEYYLPPDKTASVFTFQFDRDGHVWAVARGRPNRLLDLDPRTGEVKDLGWPDPTGGPHEILIDREGMIWMPQWTGTEPTANKRLLGFAPKTRQWEVDLPMDPDNVIRTSIKGMHSIALDSKGNIYADWMLGGALSKWDRATTGKVSVFRVPVPTAVPYGVTIDKNDNVWVALWSGNGVAKFDTTTNQWTTFTPPTYPGQTRRPNVDSKNNIWFGIWAAGKRPGKVARLDQTTGRFTEWSVPEQNAQPYDMYEDAEGNIWFPDSPTLDRAAQLVRFTPRDETFTFYPKPQFGADTPKVQVTRDGAVWYSPRSSQLAPGLGVLYPDMDKINTLGAYYLNGPPGYPFKVTTPTRASSQ